MERQKSGIERLNGSSYIKTIDYFLIVPIVLLTVIGLYVLNLVLNEEGYVGDFSRQVLASVLGIVIALVLCFLDTELLKIVGWIIYGVSLFLLILVPIDNYDMSYLWGADSWLNLPVVGTFQPSELAKIGLVMVSSFFFEQMKTKEISALRGLVYIGLVYAPPMLLIFLQPDFGTAAVIMFSFVCILFVWGVKYRYFLLGLSAAIVCGVPLIWNFYLETYQKKRILSLVFEGSDPQAEYNLVMSKSAIASGGLSGNNTGIFVSVPVKQSDFVFSAISERLGFIGTTAVILLAFFFLCRCLYVASKSPRFAYAFIVVGLTGSFAFHFIENMGMSVGLLPITGIPLPFVSQGGTAVLVNYISFGIILNISMNRKLS